MTIKTFEDSYKQFSNFYIRDVIYKNILYKTREHAFQCQKATNQKDFEYVYHSKDPYRAKQRANHIKCEPNWKNIRVKIMHEIVLSYFQQHKDAKNLLLSTGTEEIQEGNTWGDKFWGVVDGEGENWLGQILMDVRIILQGFPSVMIDNINQL